jgi:hypothetical protein
MRFQDIFGKHHQDFLLSALRDAAIPISPTRGPSAATNHLRPTAVGFEEGLSVEDMGLTFRVANYPAELQFQQGET